MEQMISNVEKLYEFDVILSLFFENPSLRSSLRTTQKRCQSLIMWRDFSSDERDLDDGNSANRNDDDEQKYDE